MYVIVKINRCNDEDKHYQSFPGSNNAAIGKRLRAPGAEEIIYNINEVFQELEKYHQGATCGCRAEVREIE